MSWPDAFSERWAGGTGGTFLGSQTALAVHLICAHIDDPLYVARHAAGFQQHVRAVGVVHREGQAVSKRVVHMRLRVPHESQYSSGLLIKDGHWPGPCHAKGLPQHPHKPHATVSEEEGRLEGQTVARGIV